MDKNVSSVFELVIHILNLNTLQNNLSRFMKFKSYKNAYNLGVLSAMGKDITCVLFFSNVEH